MEDFTDSSGERLLVENLDLVERLTRFVCRNKLEPSEVEDFSAWVKLRLVENHYGILRKFQRRCSLATYLTTVIKRLFSDYQIHRRGKWHTSAKARQLGPFAVWLELLLHRDRKQLDEAIEIVSVNEAAPSRAELVNLADELPRRSAPPSFVKADDEEQELSVSAEAAESGAMADERQRTANKVTKTAMAFLATLDKKDLTILRMRFAQEISVADIARMLHMEQKPLYRRIEAILKNLGKELVSAGIKPGDVDDLIGRNDIRLRFSLLFMGKPAKRSSPGNGSGPGDEREPR
ncbi:MAG TPA: hypothetical protein VGR02_15655 [Thermoanaerobaculia bacterium]|jgi:RNA polymerase sigma factor (sigma-70 family)|nr:hypothetical protein [Thermoanaerobaculia bacterium]